MKTLIAGLVAMALVAPALAEPVQLELAPEQIAAYGIELVSLEAVDTIVGKSLPARIAVPNAQRQVVVAPLEGFVEAMLVAEGEPVTDGQALARIRSNELLAAQAAYLESVSQRSLSASAVRRDRKLAAEGIIANRRLQEAETALRLVSGAVARDRQVLELAGMSADAIRTLEKTRRLSAALEIVSPFDGVVLEQMATAGERVDATAPLYRLGDLSTLWVEVHVPLDALGGTVPGAIVNLPELQLDARVITVGRMVHGADQSVLVRAEITAGADRLRPGQFVQARLTHGVQADALRVPSAAVVRQDDTEHVFARTEGGFVAVPVEVLAREGASTVVRGALPADARVVVRGTAALKAVLAAGGN